MKQNDSFLLQELAGIPYLLPYGQMIASHRHGLKTNATGAYLWNLLKEEHSLEELLQISAVHYDIPKEALAEFRLEISAFLNQLKAYDIITDASPDCATTDWLHAVLVRLTDSRAKALSVFSASPADNTGRLCETAFSIGGILLTYHGPEAAFPPEFEEFHALDNAVSKAKQSVILHPHLPKELPHGKLLLHNFELNIIEQPEEYLLHFPSAKTHLELHISKSGSTIHCYSLPPYTAEFHYDFFHALRLAFLYLAQKHDMAALHSASILYRDRLWLFSGSSGTGKSTHTGLWRECFKTPVINGDLNLLAVENGVPAVHGIPWCGTSGIRNTATYPLGGIILLERSKENFVEELSPDQKLLLVSQRLISLSWTKEQWKKNLDIVTKVTADCLVCKLHCTKEAEAAEVMKRKLDACKKEF